MARPAQDLNSDPQLGLSSFVGRRREVVEVRRLLSTSRLVTLTGPGGVGKTRLALEVTDAVERVFRDGTVVVRLDQVSDPALVVNAVAVAVGLREQAGREPLDMLTDYLSSRHLLLVLDNSEHLLDVVAPLADALLRSCPELRILATSREWMGIAGEVVLPVSPLALPDTDEGEARDLLEYGAVELFADRAAAVLPHFDLTEDNRFDVAEICRRLDGLPLAIELAAARLRALSATEVLAQMSDRADLLSAAPHSHAPSRQRTLRSCIEWSYGLCSEAEQLLWARVSVFAGGFELDSAEEVCSGDGLGAADVFDLITSLIDKSILVGERHPDVVRYRMLDTLREFGREQLEETEELDRLRRRHRDTFLRLVERADADWVSPRQVQWFARLDREHANVQAAVDYSLGHSSDRPGEVEAAMRMLTGLFHFYWWGRGWAREGRLWLARAFDQPSPPSAVRARALLTDASLALADGEFDVGRQRLEAAEEILTTVDDAAVAANASWIEGSVSLYSSELPAAITTFEAGLARLDPDRDLPLRLDLLLSLSSATAMLGDAERSRWCHEESMRITEPAGERFHRSYALWTLGLFVMQQGDLARAVELLRQSIDLRRDVRDLTGLGWSEESLAWAESALGHHERAAILLGAADRLWEIMGRPLRTYQHLYPLHEACGQTSEEQLGGRRFETAFAKGRAFTIDEGIAYALDEHPPAPAPAASEDTVLTTREQEIAELIAEGLTNRQIASRLTISVRTAETHAQHILTKLGLRSRAQVASWVAQQQAATPDD